MKLLIWQMRMERNMTLVELAKLTNISKSALCNYENGIRIPDMLQIESIAKALNIRITDLFESDYK